MIWGGGLRDKMSTLLQELKELQNSALDKKYDTIKSKLKEAIVTNPAATKHLLEFNIYNDCIGYNPNGYINENKKQLMDYIISRFTDDGVKCKSHLEHKQSFYNANRSYIEITL